MTGPRGTRGRHTGVARPRRRLAMGLAGLVATLAPAAMAAAAPPDLIPFVPSEGALAQSRWYVDTSVDGGVYSAKYHFPTQVANIGAGPLSISAGTPGGTPEAPVVAAVQAVEGDASVPLGPSIRLVGSPFGGGVYGWGIEGLAKYTLTPVTGGAGIDSALRPTCREDNAVFAEAGAPPAGDSAFAPAGTAIGPGVTGTVSCTNLDAAATGFKAGISSGWQDVIELSSANTAYFEIAGAAPGEGTFRASVDPSGQLTQTSKANDTDLRAIDIPGVVAASKAAILTTAGKASLQLAAQVVEPQVRGRRVTAASPASGADAAAATAAVKYAVATPPTHGTVTVSPAGAVSYDSSGAPVADTFTVIAEDSRGLRSAPAKVFIDPPGSAPRVGLGRPDVTKTVLRKTLSFKPGQRRSFTVRIPKGQKLATFSASWSGGAFGISVRKPGTKKEIRKNAKGLKLQKGRTFRSFKATRPKAGAWRFTVSRTGGSGTAKATIRVTLLRQG